MKLKSIRIQGMHKVIDTTYDVSDFTVFEGKNGAGKSTILQAIALGLFGYIPGKGKQTNEVFKHANGNYMSVCLTFDTGLTVTRSWARIKNKITCEVEPKDFSATTLFGSMDLPIFEFSSFMSMSANKQKSWFMSVLPATDCKRTITDAIMESGLPKDIVVELRSHITDDTTQSCTNILAAIKQYISVTNANIKASVNTAQNLSLSIENIPNDTFDSLSQQLRDIDAKINTYYTELRAYEQYKNNLDKLEEAKLTIDTANKQIAELSAEYGKIKNMPDTIKTTLDNLRTKHDDIVFKGKALHNQIAAIETAVCPILNTACDNLVKHKAALQSQLDTLNAETAQLPDMEQQITKLSEEYQTIIMRCNQLLPLIERHKSDLLKAETIMEQYGKLTPIKKPEIDISIFQHDKEVIMNKLQDVSQYEVKKAKLDEELHNTVNYESTLNNLKQLQQKFGPQGILSTVTQGGFSLLESNLDSYIQIMFDDCTESYFESIGDFTFGLKRLNSVIPMYNLSSGEQCMYFVALILALLDIYNVTLPLVLIDDMLDYMDNDNITKLAGILASSDVQFICASVDADIDAKYKIAI